MLSSVLLGGLALGVYLTVRRPVYEAGAEVLIEPPRFPSAPDGVRFAKPLVVGHWQNYTHSTVARVFTSRAVLIKTVRALSLPERLKGDHGEDEKERVWDALDGIVKDEVLLALQAEADTERTAAELADELAEAVSVVADKESCVLRVACATHSAELSADIVNTLTDSYLKYVHEVRVEAINNVIDWLERHRDDYEQRLFESHNSLVEAAQSLEEQLSGGREQMAKDKLMKDGSRGRTSTLGLLSERISSLVKEVTETEKDAWQVKNSLETLQDWLNSGDVAFVLPSSLSEATRNLKQLGTAIDRLRVDREALLKQFGPRHPEVKQIDGQLKAMREEARKELERTVERTRADYQLALRHLARSREMLRQAKNKALSIRQEQVNSTSLTQDIAMDQQFYGYLTAFAKQLDLAREVYEPRAHVISEAVIPQKPQQANAWLLGALTVIVSLVVGALVAFVLDSADQSIKDAEEIEHHYNLPVIGHVGDIPDLPGDQETAGTHRSTPHLVFPREQSVVTEHLRSLRTNIAFLTLRAQKVLLFTSATPAEGKSTLAANLAVMLAYGGKRVLLVDADMRRPMLHRIFKVERDPGLSNWLSSKAKVKDIVCPSCIPGIDVISSGPIPPNPTELLEAGRVMELVDYLRDSYSYIIFDAPPVCTVSDAAVLSAASDAVALVVRIGTTHRHAFSLCLRQLRMVHANILGVILNSYGPEDTGYGYYGYRRYGAYPSTYYYSYDGVEEEDDEDGASQTA